MNKSDQPLSRQPSSVQWDLPHLPHSLTTRNGANFDPREDVWAFRDTTTNLHLDFLKIQGGPMFVASAKRALLWYAENSSSHHLQNLFFRLEHFCRTVKFSMEESGEIKAWHLINYRSALTKRVEWYFSVLSGLFKKWHQLGYPGISREAVDLLGQWRGKGNIKGEAVQTMDPTQGPFSDIERSAIIARLEDGYSQHDFVAIHRDNALGQVTFDRLWGDLKDYVAMCEARRRAASHSALGSNRLIRPISRGQRL